MARQSYYQPTNTAIPNRWDFIALILVFSLFIILAWGARQMTAPYHIGQTLPISLDPSYLPEYAGRTVLRMFLAMIASLLFTFVFATWAAKSKRAEIIIIPAIDILQSVPVLVFLSLTIVGFIRLFPNSLLGPECACIFVIFTSQAWNMALSFYQTLRTVPNNLKEAAAMFHLSPWQRFWRIEVPFSMPGLLWNMMMSMSAGWFFVVASEAISVSNQTIYLPGIGSYIRFAIDNANGLAVQYAIVTMLVVILLYDQLLFRPLIKWSEKFRMEHHPDDQQTKAWLVSLLMRTQLLRYFGLWLKQTADAFVNLPILTRTRTMQISSKSANPLIEWLWTIAIGMLCFGTISFLYLFIKESVHWSEIIHVVVLGLYTSLRVIGLIIVCSVIWVPIGVWIGLHPHVAKIAQPIAQFLAAFPANLVWPIMVMMIVFYQLNVNIWVTPLMMLGTQWYVLFNVIGGTSAIPKELHQVTANFGVRGWLWWKKFIIPGIFPYYITGAMTAAGGAWNASIVAEIISWGNTTLTASGLGAYIAQQTTVGNFPRIILGIVIMCLYVLAFNRLIWRPLYLYAEDHYQLS